MADEQPFQDRRLSRYLSAVRDVHTPADILKEFWGDLEFEVIQVIGNKKKLTTLPLSSIADFMFEDDGSFPSGLPVNFEEPSREETDAIDDEIAALFRGLKPANRRDSIVLPSDVWEERTEHVFGADLCRCFPTVYVSHLRDEEFWGIYYNIESMLYHFFMPTDEKDPRTVHPVFLTAYAFMSAYRSENFNGYDYIKRIGVKTFAAQVWAEYLYFWTNFALTQHILEDIFTAHGDLDAFLDAFTAKDSVGDALHLALLVALTEGRHFGTQVLLRPILAPLEQFLPRGRISPTRRVNDVIRLAVFLSSYALIPIDVKDPLSLSEDFLHRILPYWSAFWTAHVRGVGDPLLLKSGSNYRGVRAYVKELQRTR